MSVNGTAARANGLRQNGSLRGRDRPSLGGSGGFLLDAGSSPTAYSDGKGKGKRRVLDRDSVASAASGSPSSKRQSMVSSRQSIGQSSTGGTESSPGSHIGHDAAHRSSIDAEQIVRMALSLNEGRRLNLAPGRLPSSSTSTPRAASYSSSPISDGIFLAGQSGGNMRQALNQQRRTSRNISPTPMGADQDLLRPPLSTATLDRADRARKYIELASQYRRLLETLPPLQPHRQRQRALSNSSRNNNSQVIPLGRPYNPLQYVRNRRVRADVRQVVDGEASGWTDLGRVAAWVDSVEDKADHPGFLVNDAVLLPEWIEPGATRSASIINPATNKSGRSGRPRNDWIVYPADLLADAHWVEQGSHKGEIESPRGHKIYPSFRAPDIQSFATPSSPVVPDTSSVESDGRALSGTSERLHHRQASMSDVDSDLLPKKKSVGKVTRATRTLLRRPRTASTSSSKFSGSEHEPNSPTGQRHHPRNSIDNVGPLEKHMQRIVEAESRNQSHEDLEASPEELWGRDRTQRSLEPQLGSSPRDGYAPDASSDSHLRPAAQVPTRMSHESNRSTASSSTTPRISIEDVDAPRGNIPAIVLQQPVTPKHKSTRMSFLHRGKTKEVNQIAENDFAAVTKSSEELARQVSGVPSDAFPGTSASNHAYRSSISSASLKAPEEGEIHAPKGEKALPRLFKGGRLGELVRQENSGLGDFVWKRRLPRKDGSGSSSPTTRSRYGTSEDEPDPESRSGSRHRRSHTSTDLRSPSEPRRARSATDLRDSKYHFSNLPEFKSFQTRAAGDQHRGRQHGSRNHSGSDRPAVDSDVSPNTSMLNLGRTATSTSESPMAALDHQTTYGFPNAQGTSRASEETPPASRKQSLSRDRRDIQAILDNTVAGSISVRTGLPPTGLTRLDARRNAVSRHEANKLHSWGISEGSIAMVVQQPTTVTGRELAYVQAMLLSSGIKARNLERRAHEPNSRLSEFVRKAAESSGEPLPTGQILRRQEHVIAAQTLSRALERSVSRFEETADSFRGTRCAQLHQSLDGLRMTTDNKLTPRVRSCGDDADAFMGRLTTTHTLSVTRVNDQIDGLLRRRWRRVRLLRQVGFGGLEWLLVGIMWFIWLLVMIIHVIKTAVVGVFRVVRWIVW